MPDDLEDFFRTDVLSAEAAIGILKQEVAALQMALTAKLETGSDHGVFVAQIPDDYMTRKLVDDMHQAWIAAWRIAHEGLAPPLLMLSASIRIDHLCATELQLLGLMRIPNEMNKGG